MCAASVSWWLDYSALPEREIWARLDIEESGKATVHDRDGRKQVFRCSADAVNSLLEDEYSMLENIDEEEFIDGRKPLPPILPTIRNRP
jgi:hypothetical protein